MAKWKVVGGDSLSFRDRTLSKAAANGLLTGKNRGSLGGIIDTVVVTVKTAKTAKAHKATNEHFARRTKAYGFTVSPDGLVSPQADEMSGGPQKAREVA